MLLRGLHPGIAAAAGAVAPSYPGTWNPADFGTVLRHYSPEGSYSAGVWEDISAAGVDTTLEAGAAPTTGTLNGLRSIVFSGSNRLSTGLTQAAIGPQAVILVAGRITGANGSEQWIIADRAPFSVSAGLGIYRRTANDVRGQYSSGSGVVPPTTQANTNILINVPFAVAYNYRASSLSNAGIDVSVRGGGATLSGQYTTDPHAAGGNTMPVLIGGRNGAFGLVDIAEVVIFSGLTSTSLTAARALLDNLTAKYGVSAA